MPTLMRTSIRKLNIEMGASDRTCKGDVVFVICKNPDIRKSSLCLNHRPRIAPSMRTSYSVPINGLPSNDSLGQRGPTLSCQGGGNLGWSSRLHVMDEGRA